MFIQYLFNTNPFELVQILAKESSVGCKVLVYTESILDKPKYGIKSLNVCTHKL